MSALKGGILLGGAYFGVLLHWIPWALARISPLAVPAYLAVVAVLAALTGLVAWCALRLERGWGLPVWLSLPLAWTAGEWLRAHLPGGLAFPWLGLGTSLTGYPEVAGAAEIVGARGITLWLALSGSLAGLVLARKRDGRGWGRPAAAFALVVLLPAGWGLWRARTLDLRPAARVAVLQPGSHPVAGTAPRPGVERTLALADELAPRVRSVGPDLVVWPEAALPVAIREPAWAAQRERVERWADRVGAPVLFGAYGEGVGGGRFNSAFLVEPARGLTEFRYDKRFLVPAIEGRAFRGAIPGTGSRPGPSLRAGAEPPEPVEVAGLRAGVLICYESSFPGLARRYRRRGADLLVNLTNDAWFGGEAAWARTGGLWQHPAHLVMRAIETRTGVVRAATTGFSLFVDPVGRVRGRTALFEPGMRVAEVRTSDVSTVYVALGDLAGTGSVVLTLLLMGAGAVLRTGVDSVNKNRYC